MSITKSFVNHVYAQEMNTVIFSRGNKQLVESSINDMIGYRFGITTDLENYKKLFTKPTTAKRCVKIKFYYNEQRFEHLNKVVSGAVNSYSDILKFINQYKQKNTGGKLLNGDTLPQVKAKIESIRLIHA